MKKEKNKVAFYTLGCKVNAYETNVMIDIFKNNGYEIVDFNEVADVYVVNTCTVTSMSDKKSRQILRRAKHLNPNSVLCAVGCYAQVAKSELEKIDDIDIILGTIEKKDILKKIADHMPKNNANIEFMESKVSDDKINKQKNIIDKQKNIMVENIMKVRAYDEFDGTAYTTHARAEVKIQDGCDRFCSYCIIPYARGPVRSRKPEEIINEIKRIVASGVKEIVITGIHISSYGKDFKYSNLNFDNRFDAQGAHIQAAQPIVDDILSSPKYGLIDLLESINKIDGIARIRLGSLEPRIITEEFVKRLVKLDKICNHFHLSLQSGCDETLKRMNRKYTTAEFKNIVSLLRKNIPEVALTTDVIVGFPGETDEEFNKTVEFLKEVEFSKMHIFKYSKRKGTPAATFPNQVSDNKKEERSNVLLDLSDKNEENFAKKYINKEVEVLFENAEEGHTTNYLKVIRSNKNEASEIKSVIVREWKNGALYV